MDYDSCLSLILLTRSLARALSQFGMTSLSVRQYIVGIYRELKLDESKIMKVQTGGPDGDLGSNEILLSKDKTIT